MIWLIAAGAAAITILYLGSLFISGEIRKLVRALRWLVGGVMMAGAVFIGVRGQMMIASLLAAGGLGVLMRGRLGPVDFGAGMASPNTASTVSSSFFTMRLDHDTGTVSGTVRAGHFKGRELADLSADECWALYDEVEDDPDSAALFESWLDANRSGWRDYFAAEFGMETEAGADEPHRETGGAVNTTEEAYEILGLAPGASADAIRAAHRTLMKKMHPDAGGSAFLAAKINQAKDMLLKHAAETRKS